MSIAPSARDTETGKCEQWLESTIPVSVTISVFVVSTSLVSIFICPWYIDNIPISKTAPLLAVFAATGLSTLVNFSLARFRNPGFLPKAPANREHPLRQPSIVKINQIQIPLKICRTCHYYRLPRTSHCHQCDQCVDNFDHHCPWVNNCVGRRNYRFFFAFLICITGHTVVILSINVYYLIYHPDETWDISKIIAAFLSVLASIIFPFVFGLSCFHIFLIGRGLTTYEYVSHKYPPRTNPFDNGRCNNCGNQLCGPEFPIFKLTELLEEEEENERKGEMELSEKLQKMMVSDRSDPGGKLPHVQVLDEKGSEDGVNATKAISSFEVQLVDEGSHKMVDTRNNNNMSPSTSQILPSESDCTVSPKVSTLNDIVRLDDPDLERMDGAGEVEFLSIWVNKREDEIVVLRLPPTST